MIFDVGVFKNYTFENTDLQDTCPAPSSGFQRPCLVWLCMPIMGILKTLTDTRFYRVGVSNLERILFWHLDMICS